jgi:hypothetical protein
MEPRTLIDAQNSVHAAHYAAHDTANDSTDRAGGSFALARAAFDSTGNPLVLSHGGQRHAGGNNGNTHQSTNHDRSCYRFRLQDKQRELNRFRGLLARPTASTSHPTFWRGRIETAVNPDSGGNSHLKRRPAGVATFRVNGTSIDARYKSQ